MKKSLLILAAVLFSCSLVAQIRPAAPGGARVLPPPLPVRQISGIVKDTTDATVPGAVVKLKGKNGADSAITSTNGDGVFVFKNIKPFEFTIVASSLGYRTFAQNYKMNDAAARLTLDPIILKSASTALKEVVVNGTPSIVYKVDTIEYRASDYKVRPNATLDELLKKMEGMEVGSDGSLTHQGQAVTKVKLNGKDYAGGDVAQAIQNLPADIIEKAQIVDDYGDQAARSGIKSGDPQKILNVTTKADRSVGTTARLTGQAGNNDRYNVQLFAQRINANQQIGIIGGIRNLVTGVASTGAVGGNGGTGGSPGTAQTLNPSLNYRDQYGPKVQVNSSATYGFTNRNSVSQSFGSTSSAIDTIHAPANPNTVLSGGNGTFSRNGTNQTNQKNRSLNVELDYQIDSLNYLQIQPNYSYNTSENINSNFQDGFDHLITYKGGVVSKSIQHLVTNGTTVGNSPTTNAGALVLFNHRFRKPRRNFSLQATYSYSNTQNNAENNNDYKYYKDSTLNTVIKDSLVHLFQYRENSTNQVRVSSTYSEPLGTYSQLEFNGQVNYNNHSTNNTSDTVLADGTIKQLDRLTLLYNYATTETRLSFNYRYQGTKVNLSLGTTLAPYYLTGTKLNNGIGANVTTSKNDFRILPIVQFSYSWSRTQRFTLRYSGNTSEPQFQQIQPFTDRSNVNNIIVGNPDLRATLNNSVNVGYNNYFPNSRFNISFNANGTYITDESTTNTLRIPVVIVAANPALGIKEQDKLVSETHYVNLTGSQSIGGNYNISKQLADRRYNLALNGRVQYNYSLAMSNNLLYHQTGWELNERFGPRISPSDNVEVNPYISTDLRRTFTTTAGDPWSRQLTNTLGIDGRFYFFKTYQVHYDARKQLITQVNSTNLTAIGNNSPLVIDAGFQKEIGQKRAFTVTFDMFDLLHQNNFIEQTVTSTGLTNTVSSSLSRYFLIGFRLNLQKWSGRPQRNGRDMQRRGDGSFIYN